MDPQLPSKSPYPITFYGPSLFSFNPQMHYRPHSPTSDLLPLARLPCSSNATFFEIFGDSCLLRRSSLTYFSSPSNDATACLTSCCIVFSLILVSNMAHYPAPGHVATIDFNFKTPPFLQTLIIDPIISPASLPAHLAKSYNVPSLSSLFCTSVKRDAA